MKQKYDIDSLIVTFFDHAKKVDRQFQEDRKNYIDKYGEPYPPEKDAFNICHALLEICKEIKAINDWIVAHGEN